MKRCNTCGKEYDDSKMFCPVCGGQLTAVITSPSEPTVSSSGSKASPSFFANWGGALLALIGLIVAWELSAIFGLALAVVGVVFGWNSPNKINKILSVVLGGVTVIMFIWYILA